jgi:hypothetical protein
VQLALQVHSVLWELLPQRIAPRVISAQLQLSSNMSLVALSEKRTQREPGMLPKPIAQRIVRLEHFAEKAP